MGYVIDDRLPLDEVERYVSFLPVPTLELLAKGPVPDEDGCRACQALNPLISSGPATTLLYWHNSTNETSLETWQERIGDAGISRETPEGAALLDHLQDVVGSLGYARCCVIYSAAKNELAKINAGG